MSKRFLDMNNTNCFANRVVYAVSAQSFYKLICKLCGLCCVSTIVLQIDLELVIDLQAVVYWNNIRTNYFSSGMGSVIIVSTDKGRI